MGKRFSVEMEGEKDSGGKRELVPEGEQILIIRSVTLVTEEESGSGKPYFKWELESKIGFIPIDTITTLIKGKRWLLKQLLSACGIKAKEDDPDKKYDFTEENVLKKEVMAFIKHNNENSFIGKEGNKITIPKAEVKRFENADPEIRKAEAAEKKAHKEKDKEDENIPF